MTLSPLAFEMLLMSSLAMNAGIEVPGYTHSNDKEWREVTDFAHAEGLWGDNGLTPRCRAWLDMIHAVPLPVQQWIDPRVNHELSPEYVAALRATNAYPFTRNAVSFTTSDPDARPPLSNVAPPPPMQDDRPALNPSPEQKAAAYAATVPKPPEGFTHHIGMTSKMPDGLKPGDDIEVWYRDGKSGKQAKVGKRADVLAAASINWQHRGGDDDVIGFRRLDQPEVVKMVMPKR
jgi:hypothetical protein